MNQHTLDTSLSAPSLLPRIAWRNALGIVVLLWLLLVTLIVCQKREILLEQIKEAKKPNHDLLPSTMGIE